MLFRFTKEQDGEILEEIRGFLNLRKDTAKIELFIDNLDFIAYDGDGKEILRDKYSR